MSSAHHLSLHDILAIRDTVATSAGLEDPEWRFELVNPNGLISALTTPFQIAFGVESFPEVPDKAAALAFLLIANHPFRDGNKRIAAAALQLFLQRNGRTVTATPQQIEAFTMQITAAHLRDAALVAWITQHTTHHGDVVQ